jgi:hypothetical protein
LVAFARADMNVPDLLNDAIKEMQAFSGQLWIRDLALLLAVSLIAYLPGWICVRILNRYQESPRFARSHVLRVTLEIVKVSFWINDPWETPTVQSALYFSIWYKLKEAGIEILFPQRDLHFRSGEIEVALKPEGGMPTRDRGPANREEEKTDG